MVEELKFDQHPMDPCVFWLREPSTTQHVGQSASDEFLVIPKLERFVGLEACVVCSVCMWHRLEERDEETARQGSVSKVDIGGGDGGRRRWRSYRFHARAKR